MIGSFVGISDDGQMNASELVENLEQYQIAPIVVIHDGDDVVVPLFRSGGIARRFVERNSVQQCIVGNMKINAIDLQYFADRGWRTVLFEHPNKREIFVEVVELNRKVTTHSLRG
jgi:hypothetical protein